MMLLHGQSMVEGGGHALLEKKHQVVSHPINNRVSNQSSIFDIGFLKGRSRFKPPICFVVCCSILCVYPSPSNRLPAVNFSDIFCLGSLHHRTMSPLFPSFCESTGCHLNTLGKGHLGTGKKSARNLRIGLGPQPWH